MNDIEALIFLFVVCVGIAIILSERRYEIVDNFREFLGMFKELFEKSDMRD